MKEEAQEEEKTKIAAQHQIKMDSSSNTAWAGSSTGVSVIQVTVDTHSKGEELVKKLLAGGMIADSQ